MSPLETLRRSFKPVAIPDAVPAPRGLVGVYMLVLGDEIVYVGSSSGIEFRLYQHAVEEIKEFDSALWVSLPPGVHPHYEGAFIRALRPRYNRVAPRHCGYDNEILEGFGLEPHADESANNRAYLDRHNQRRVANREARESRRSNSRSVQ
jgi:hypothetical protein